MKKQVSVVLEENIQLIQKTFEQDLTLKIHWFQPLAISGIRCVGSNSQFTNFTTKQSFNGDCC